MQTAADPVADRIRWGWRRVTGTDPQPADLDRLMRLHGAALERYRDDPDLARAAAGSAESAALTLVASTLLNLDAALTR